MDIRVLEVANMRQSAGVILVLLNLTCTVKDSCEPKCPFLSFKVHRVSFSDNFVQNYRKTRQIQSIFETFMQPNNRFCCLCMVSAQLEDYEPSEN